MEEGRKNNSQFAFFKGCFGRWSANEQFYDPLIGISFVHGHHHKVALEFARFHGTIRRVNRDNGVHLNGGDQNWVRTVKELCSNQKTKGLLDKHIKIVDTALYDPKNCIFLVIGEISHSHGSYP